MIISFKRPITMQQWSLSIDLSGYLRAITPGCAGYTHPPRHCRAGRGNWGWTGALLQPLLCVLWCHHHTYCQVWKYESSFVHMHSTFPPQSNCCIGIVLTKAPQQCPRDPPLRLSAPQVSRSGPPVECNNKTAAIRHRKHLWGGGCGAWRLPHSCSRPQDDILGPEATTRTTRHQHRRYCGGINVCWNQCKTLIYLKTSSLKWSKRWPGYLPTQLTWESLVSRIAGGRHSAPLCTFCVAGGGAGAGRRRWCNENKVDCQTADCWQPGARAAMAKQMLATKRAPEVRHN